MTSWTKQWGAGARQRIHQHLLSIEKVKRKQTRERSSDGNSSQREGNLRKGVPFAHTRLTHGDTENVQYSILRALPVPNNDARSLSHFHCLLTPAKSIDKILSNALSEKAPLRSVFRLGNDFGRRIRPKEIVYSMGFDVDSERLRSHA